MEGIFPSPAEAETEEEMFTMPTIDMVATGRNIMRLREVAGLTVRDLQDIFGFATPQAIYKWQHGTAMPTIDNLVVLAAVLDVPMDEIIVIDVNITKQISALKENKQIALSRLKCSVQVRRGSLMGRSHSGNCSGL